MEEEKNDREVNSFQEDEEKKDSDQKIVSDNLVREDASSVTGEPEEVEKDVAKPQEEEETERDKEVESNGERIFHKAFYCPKTGQIMKDPVVHPDGTSYERSAVESDTDVVYYPNRALQAIIQHEVLRYNVPLQRTIDSMRKSFQELVQRSSFAVPSEFRPLPDHYYCSITLDIMKNPVIDPDGQSFDRRAITNWIKVNGNSPATRNPLTIKQLYDNNAIKDLLEEEKDHDDSSIHPSIRRWKEQTDGGDDDDFSDLDLEEGDFAGTGSAPTPTSMEEIEALRRRRMDRERNSKWRLCFTLFVIFVGLIYFPYTTLLLVVVFLMIAFCVKRSAEERMARDEQNARDALEARGVAMAQAAHAGQAGLTRQEDM